MLLKWRLISVATLLAFTVGGGYVWWERGIARHDYFRAGLMLVMIWWAFCVVARISVAVPDPALRRVLLPVAAALVLPTFAYHAYNASNLAEVRLNLLLLLGVGVYSYVQIFGKECTEDTPS